MRSRLRWIALLAASAALLSLTACGLGIEAQSAKQDVSAIDPAADTQAQSNLQTAIIAAKTAAALNGSFAGVTVTIMQQNEPSLSYVNGTSTGPNSISVMPSGTAWDAAVLSTSGTCFYAVVTLSSVQTGSAKAPCAASNAAGHTSETG